MAKTKVPSGILQEVELETYPQTTCYEGQVDHENELCVGGRMLKPVIGVYSQIETGFEFVNKYGGEKYEFYGYKVSWYE